MRSVMRLGASAIVLTVAVWLTQSRWPAEAMILLDATTKSVEVVLGGAVTTNQLPFTADYADITTTTFTPGHNDGTTNNTTAVTMVAAPGASTQRQVKFLSVYNADTATATVTIRYNNNATTRVIVTTTLPVGSTLEYTDGHGFRVISSSGQIQQGGGAPDSASFVTNVAEASLSNEQALASLSSGIMRVATTTGAITSLTDSSGLATNVSDETGSGALVFATSPTLVTPNLGTPSAATLTNATGLPISTGVSGLGTNVATFLATPSSANFAAAVTGETGTGGVVFDTSPTVVTPTIASFTNATHTHQAAAGGGQLDHGAALTGLTDDDHTQYGLLAGRATGQTLIGGTAAGDDLTLKSTSHATLGTTFLDAADAVELASGTSAMELRLREPSGGGTSYTGFKAPALAGNVIYTLPTADGSANQVLSTNGSTVLSWAAGGSSPISLLKAGSGTTTTATAENVDTIAISGLTAKDTLLIYYNLDTVTQDTGEPVLYNSTDSVQIVRLNQGNVLAAGQIMMGLALIRQSQQANTTIHGQAMTRLSVAASDRGDMAASTFTTAWTGSWTLGLRHAGVTSGGTFRWSWAIYKLAGQ